MDGSLYMGNQPISLSNPMAVNTSVANALTNGCTNHRRIATADVNSVSLKGSAGTIAGGYVFNTSAATKYLKLYNKATAPTVGTDTPIMTLPIAPSTGLLLAAAFDNFGLWFSTGIGYAITGAAADADATALTAGDVILNLIYV